MAKKSSGGPERGPFPERFEVPFFHVLRVALKWLTKKTLNGMEKAAPEMFLAGAWIYTKESAENLKRWTEGSLLAAGLFVENIADILPLPSWFRKTLESLASDLPLNIAEYFTLRQAKNDIHFPLGYEGPKAEDVKQTINAFAAKFLEGFRNLLAKHLPFFAKLRERWLRRRGASREFKDHSFKVFRAILLDLANASPPDLEEFNRIWDDELTPQDRWNLMESPEYLGTFDRVRAFLSMTPPERRMWLDLQDHDDLFNFLSPAVKAKAMEVAKIIDGGVGKLAGDLEAWADGKARQRAKKKSRPKFKTNRKVMIVLGLAILFMIVFLTLLPKYPLGAAWFAVVTILSVLALGTVVLISKHASAESIRRSTEANHG